MKLVKVLTFGEEPILYNLSDGLLLRNDVDWGDFRKSNNMKDIDNKGEYMDRIYGDITNKIEVEWIFNVWRYSYI